ncbi:MAG: ABC transporter permease [Micromonosporaceae bacterium]
MCFFAVMSNCLFTFGVGVAEDREKPWQPYLRTMPAGRGPAMGARLLNGLTWSLLALAPLLVTAWLLTAASISPVRLALSGALLAVGALPFLFGGLAIGYLMPTKAALAVAQVVMFSFAFGGGLFLPPSLFPDWLDRLSMFLPSRSGRDLLEWGALDGNLSSTTTLTVAAWTAAMVVAAGWAYRRDQGQRFR